MIHARTSFDPLDKQPVLHLSFVGVPALKQLQTVVNKAINCNAEFGKDWFDIADNLDKMIRAADPTAR